jgi:two-component system, NtrC family, nitrogen regulation response regulator GlnG
VFRSAGKPRDFLVADSTAMKRVAAAIEELAETDAPVLICGERGTGRELVARVLHFAGPRRESRFVSVSPELAPGEESGRDEEGPARRALRAAQGGTLLIKEVCDLPIASQRTLKRALRKRPSEAKPVRPPDDSTGEVYDVRVVGSSDVDLASAVEARLFNRELYEQLEAHRIDVPPLRERLADLPALCDKWLRHYAQELGRGRVTVLPRAFERLAAYPWPGNVGELKAMTRRLVMQAQSSKIDVGDVDAVLPSVSGMPLEEMAFEEMVRSKVSGFLARMEGYPVEDLYEKVLERVERPLFDLILEHTGGNQVRAAEILGLNRNTLRRKLAQHGLSEAAKKTRQGRSEKKAKAGSEGDFGE